MTAEVLHGDCLDVMRTLGKNSVDAIVTDPPYGLSFMGRNWDHGVPGAAFWAEALRVAKPGAYMLAFGGTRTYHRLTCAIEDAGFEIRDCVMWVYGSGFPKGKGCLKPAWEPIILARKPGKSVLPLQIDACRVGTDAVKSSGAKPGRGSFGGKPDSTGSHIWNGQEPSEHAGRWPANLAHDGSDEVMEAFAVAGESKSPAGGVRGQGLKAKAWRDKEGRSDHGNGRLIEFQGHGDTGTAARFFYCAKASRADRDEGLNEIGIVPAGVGSHRPSGDMNERLHKGEREKVMGKNTHPTVKPTALMQYLCRLITPPGGLVLDPFCGSGSTGKAAVLEGLRFVGIEREVEYVEIARQRIAAAQAETPLFTEAEGTR